MERSTERVNIVSCSSSKVAGRHIEAMHKIDKLFFGEPFKQFAIRFSNGVPSHGRHFILMFLRDKTFHIHIKDIQTIDFSFFGMPAHQLHAETNSKYRLTEILNQFVQSRCLQVVHGSFRLSHSGKNNFIGRLEFFFISSNHRFYPQPL